MLDISCVTTLYFILGRDAKYCDLRGCMSVCLSVRMSQKPHVQTSRNFLHIVTDLNPWSLLCSPALTSLQYVTYFWFCGWRHVFRQRCKYGYRSMVNYLLWLARVFRQHFMLVCHGL